MTRPRTRPVTGRFPGQFSRRTARIAVPLRTAAQLAGHSPVQRHAPHRVQPVQAGSRRLPAGALLTQLEIPRSRGDTPHAPGVCRFVVTGYWRLVRSLDGMGTSGTPQYRARQRQRERQWRQQAQRTTPSARSAPAPADGHGPERRTAATACGWCGGPITPGRRGPIPKWCSATCRHRAWEQARAAASGLSAVKLVERRLEVQVPLVPTRRDWPRLLGEFAGQLNDGRVYDRDLPALARALQPVLEAYRRRAHLTGARDVR
jgi:hypothetical protein